jgi:hypothetical protein
MAQKNDICVIATFNAPLHPAGHIYKNEKKESRLTAYILARKPKKVIF